jgi:hypothetical protein
MKALSSNPSTTHTKKNCKNADTIITLKGLSLEVRNLYSLIIIAK